MLREGIDTSEGRNWAVAMSGPGSREVPTVLHLAFSLAALDLAGIGVVLDQLSALLEGEPVDLAAAESITALADRISAERYEVTAQVPQRRALGGPVLPAPSREQAGAELRVDTLTRSLSEETYAGLQRRALQLSVSTAALALTVYENTLAQWSETPEFSVIVPGIDARHSRTVAERTMGYAHQRKEQAGRTFAERCQQSAAQLRHLAKSKADSVVEYRDATLRGEDVAPSQYVFTFGAETPLYTDRTRATLGVGRWWSTTPQVALDCRITRPDAGNGASVDLDVRTSAVSPELADQVLDLYVARLEAVAHATEFPDLPPRTQCTRRTANASSRVSERLLYSKFRERAASAPEAVALVSGDHTLTYAELDRLARHLAAAIARETTPGDVVAVELPRGPQQIAAALAVLYAGCVYLPISAHYPAARKQAIKERSQWAMAVSEDFVRNLGPAPAQSDFQPLEVVPDAPAYTIFTSGSTGQPKGVLVSHAAAANTIDDVNKRNRITDADTAIGVAGLDFDLSVYDIFGLLSAGGSLVLIDEAETRDPFRWAELITEHGVTVWNSVPMLLDMLLTAAPKLPGMRRWLISGDKLPADLPPRALQAAPGSELAAMGGATEAAIWSNEYRIASEADIDPAWSQIPYGRPLSGQQYRVVGEATGCDGEPKLADLPDGVVGELLIGGAGVAMGYLGDPAKTAGAFFTEPDGTPWYHTGDLGYWRDGIIYIVGRADHQVKIRGHRVECGEVEANLVGLPGIRGAAVVPIRGNSALGAVLATEPTAEEASPSSLPWADHAGESQEDAAQQWVADSLRAALPWYEIPASVKLVDTLPLTSNGKADRKQIVATFQSGETPGQEDHPTGEHPEYADLADEPVARAVAETWQRALGAAQAIEPGANFFALGGDSLTATTMCARLRELGHEAQLPMIFRSPTLAGFTAEVAGAAARSTTEAEQAEPEPRKPAETWRDRADREGVDPQELGLERWVAWLWAFVLGQPTDAPGDNAGDAPGAKPGDASSEATGTAPSEAPGIGADDDFFALGGDSLGAARLMVSLEESGIRVDSPTPVAVLFRQPTLGAFLEACSWAPENDAPGGAADADAEPGADGEGLAPRREGHVEGAQEPFPLTPLQLAYALGADGIPGIICARPCIALTVEADREVTAEEWQQALTEVVGAYEVLRLVRCHDTSQEVAAGAASGDVVPEVLRFPFPLTDEGMQDILRRASVAADENPAVRGYWCEHLPRTLGLVFNYLALDSTSIALVLDDLARALQRGSGVARVSVQPFIEHAHALTAGGSEHSPASTEDETAPQEEVDLSPLIPGAVPEHEVVFASVGELIDAAELEGLKQAAARRRVTVNSLLLRAFGAAVAGALGVDTLPVKVPASYRPSEHADATGQFTRLVECSCGSATTAETLHAQLGAAKEGATARTESGWRNVPAVFTSLLGSRLAEPLGDAGALQLTWTHTRTPSVAIDCQITPLTGGNTELRWDYPEGVVDAERIAEAFAEFCRLVAKEAA